MTQIEMMIAVGLVAIMSSLALPSIGNLLDRTTMTTSGNELLTDLNFARQQAITGSTRVVICPADDHAAEQPRCTDSSDWQSGWIIFQDTNTNRQFDTGDTLLRAGLLGEGLRANSGGRKQFRFLSDGTALGQPGSIYVCSDNDSSLGTRFVISNAGRIRTEPDTSRCG